MNHRTTRTEIDAALSLLDTLGDNPHHLKLAGRLVRSLVNGYVREQLPTVVPTDPNDSNFTREEMDCLLAQQKIATIKLIRARLGYGLREAKDYVEEFGNKYLIPPSSF